MARHCRGMIIRMRFLRRMSMFVLAILPLVAFTAKARDDYAGADGTGKDGLSRRHPPRSAALARAFQRYWPSDRWELLWLHQRISEQVMAASLQVDATIAQIDNEISRANELRGYLSDRRDKLGEPLQPARRDRRRGRWAPRAPACSSCASLEKPGDAVGIAGGTVSAGLASSRHSCPEGKDQPLRIPFQHACRVL